ncbi:transglutaminase family protein [Nakamurella silvestris]|nr:transglutaminase family protein [Nakamurella silvestris]
MGIKVALEHRTAYTFDRQVELHPHVIRLRPAPHSRTPIEAYSLKIEPANHFLNWQQDPFGNFLARVVFPEKSDSLTITVGLVADMQVINAFDFFIEDYAETYPFSYPADLAADLDPYLRSVDESAPGDGPGPAVRAWLERFEIPGDIGIVDFLVALNSAVYRDVGYSVRMEEGVQTPDFTLTSAIGSCRDSGWLLVSLLRELGLAARFVSGYLVQLTSDGESLDGPNGPAADFTDLHAWTEVYIPGAGWIGLDPTSGLFAGEGHIPLSATPHPASAAAITGATGITNSTLDYSNVVRRVHEDPRVTLPYTDEQWDRIQEFGEAVDAKLVEGDVRLTMGGEPTFVSIDDFVSDQWTTAADGPDKRDRAGELAERLHQIYAKGGFVHRGQGKWYPGEPLPRWQIGLYWRTDGESLWSNPELFDDPWAPGNPELTAEDAHRFVNSVAIGFALPDSQVRPAYEDALARMLQEVRLPDGSPPEVDLTGDTDGSDARAALLAATQTAVAAPTAWLLPLHRLPDGSGWASADWRLRRGQIALIPGDSPAGLRLPLNAIAWEGPEVVPEVDPLAPVEDLEITPIARPGVAAVVPAQGAPTTAVVVEVREGHLFVFLPPLARLEDYLELLGVVEQAATVLQIPVVLEGYTPPSDQRLQNLTVTPDPGVIEVNVQPTSSWSEQVDLTTTLFEQARLTRLGAQAFDVDGTHTGTGGGSHITLGGTTPADSPLLRRPDLLVSLLTYWQHHPSLSYLFSGRFIGPTSQAPRADEGRPENVYEMEIAFSEIERLTEDARAKGEDASPWIIDRALRHLLTDLTGNTHRAEFCIDKLYSPDSARGRLGLLELRGFEMPPHPQMALVQALLVRSLVARFWAEPLRAPLVQHGVDLHGRHLLPYFVTEDIAEVAADLRRHGFDFPTSWLDPFTEFRFPRLGSTTVAGVDLELRSAIEPWHVLGEEATGSGTARYVDSSVERLQVLVDGADPARHILTCNGVPVPLGPTGVPGRQVAGVRYRAWQPPSALHPSIAPHSPLVFDLIDVDSALSLGGCRYHVVHPGGRSYEKPPVNALEAQSRRTNRFEALGFTAGAIDVAGLREKAARLAADTAPMHILDLRRAAMVCR